MNIPFGCMSFVNLIFYYAILILYYAKLTVKSPTCVVHTCSTRHCIMRYESSILRDAFVSVVFCFMNELARLLLRHLVDICLFQSAQSASLLWITILHTFYEFKHTSYLTKRSTSYTHTHTVEVINKLL